MFKVLELSELDVCLVGTCLNFQWLGGQKKLLGFGLLGKDHYPLWLGTSRVNSFRASVHQRFLGVRKWSIFVNPFQPSVAFYIETSHLFRREKQMTDLYMKRNTGLKWVKNIVEVLFLTVEFHVCILVFFCLMNCTASHLKQISILNYLHSAQRCTPRSDKTCGK